MRETFCINSEWNLAFSFGRGLEGSDSPVEEEVGMNVAVMYAGRGDLPVYLFHHLAYLSQIVDDAEIRCTHTW